MKKKELNFIKKNLGNDFLVKLEKADIIKLNTSTGVSPEEIKVALQIVPRYILSYLFINLKYINDGGNVELTLPFANGTLHANKHSNDNYSGEIIADNKVVNEFKNRSLPSIGLLLMSTFELYDMSNIDEIRNVQPEQENKIDKLQELIDERLRMQNLISAVVDQKIAQNEAIRQLVELRVQQKVSIPKEETMMEKAPSKLREFLDNKEKKRQGIDKNVGELDKSQDISCPDCGTNLYKSGNDHIRCCICMGDHMNKKIKILKTEDGVKLKFPKNFEEENIEMLLETIKG